MCFCLMWQKVKTELASLSETLVLFYQITGCDIPESIKLHYGVSITIDSGKPGTIDSSYRNAIPYFIHCVHIIGQTMPT